MVLKARVAGHVQGVGYRYFCYRLAVKLGLSGYAKNLPDGSVEVVACGDRARLEAFLQALWTGPSLSRVTNVEAAWEEKELRLPGFSTG